MFRETPPVVTRGNRGSPLGIPVGGHYPLRRLRPAFPIVGSLGLRYPNKRLGDAGQSMGLISEGTTGVYAVVRGPSAPDIHGRRVAVARSPSVLLECGPSHNLDVVKAKGLRRSVRDAMLACRRNGRQTSRRSSDASRCPRRQGRPRGCNSRPSRATGQGFYSAVPNETIAAGNSNNVRASVFGYRTYGSLMNPRQALLFAATVRIIRELIHRT